MNRIRVLRIINRFNLGGITYNVSYLSRYMPDRYETMLAGGPEEKNEASSLFIPVSLGLEPIVLEEMRRSVNPFSDLKAYLTLRKIIRQFRPHIVHTHASKAGALGRLAAIHAGVPVIVHTFHGHVFHGYFGNVKTGLYKLIERYLAKRSSAVVAISETQKRELSRIHKICAEQKIEVIPLGFDLQRFTEYKEERRRKFRAKYNIGEDELVLGIIGRLVPIKDHILFIRAVSHCLKNSRRKIRAVIVGDGQCRESMQREIQNLGHSYSDGAGPDPFIFTGWMRDVHLLLPGLDLVCLTSRNEGTPVSLIEAQAAGRFIVSTEVGGIRDIMLPGAGMLSPPGDTAGYIKNLLEAVRNFEYYHHSAGRASAEVIEKFSYSRLCADMDRLYSTLLASAKQS